jgi:ATP-dependent protease ClpP protease subunit
MGAPEAKEYGLVDEVVNSRKDIPNFAELTKSKSD